MSDLLLHPLVWVAAAVTGHGVLAYVTWSSSAHSPANRLDEWVAAAARRPERLRLARAAGLTMPLILAAWLRVAEPAELGLVAPSGPRGIAAAVGFTFVAFLLVAAGATSFARATGAPPPGRSRPVTLRWAGATLLDAAGLEAYWAFVRGAVLSVGLANAAAAVFVSLGILALQGWADPTNRTRFVDPDGAGILGVSAVKAIASAAVFLACGSLLATWTLHAALSSALYAAGLDRGPDTLDQPADDPLVFEPTIV